MKLLFDQNVSRRLVAMFPIEYPESQHVTGLGLDTATDAEGSARLGVLVSMANRVVLPSRVHRDVDGSATQRVENVDGRSAPK